MSLKHIEGRVVCSVDLEGKNWHTFADGTKIRLEREYNEFNRRITQPVNGTVISAEHIPEGSEILIHHNALHEVNRVYDYKRLSGEDVASDVKYYSLPETDCFAWRDKDGELKPMKNFAFALRVYEPYKGVLQGILPKIVPNVLYITTGELTGLVCHVLKAADYEIIYQGQSGREERIIRCRYFPDEINEREEIVAISNSLTKKVNDGSLIIGLSVSDAKPLNVLV